jgi:RNA polymerase sigma-70 factor (ECF subfamily)
MAGDVPDIRSLLERIAGEDYNAFRLFYELYYPAVYRSSSSLLKSSLIVEEVVSDVFCMVWENRKKNLLIENFDAYMYATARHQSLLYLNRENRYTPVALEQSSDLEPFVYEETPENGVIDEEMDVALRKAIDDLPERCRAIFLLAREDHLKYKEIARILSISEKTVNSQMVLAIKKLVKSLGKLVAK